MGLQTKWNDKNALCTLTLSAISCGINVETEESHEIVNKNWKP